MLLLSVKLTAYSCSPYHIWCHYGFQYFPVISTACTWLRELMWNHSFFANFSKALHKPLPFHLHAPKFLSRLFSLISISIGLLTITGGTQVSRKITCLLFFILYSSRGKAEPIFWNRRMQNNSKHTHASIYMFIIILQTITTSFNVVYYNSKIFEYFYYYIKWCIFIFKCVSLYCLANQCKHWSLKLVEMYQMNVVVLCLWHRHIYKESFDTCSYSAERQFSFADTVFLSLQKLFLSLQVLL